AADVAVAARFNASFGLSFCEAVRAGGGSAGIVAFRGFDGWVGGSIWIGCNSCSCGRRVRGRRIGRRGSAIILGESGNSNERRSSGRGHDKAHGNPPYFGDGTKTLPSALRSKEIFVAGKASP